MTELETLQQQAREDFIKKLGASNLDNDLGMFIHELIAFAYHVGENKAVDYIASHSEEAVEGLFYVTNSVLESARNAV